MQDATPAGTGTTHGGPPLRAVAAIVVAAVANLVVFQAASAAGLVPPGLPVPTPYGPAPLTALPVVVASVVGAAGAAAAFAATRRLARRPVRVFRAVATVLLALSLVGPATIPGAPVEMVLTLGAMHVVVWAASVVLLTAPASRSPRERG